MQDSWILKSSALFTTYTIMNYITYHVMCHNIPSWIQLTDWTIKKCKKKKFNLCFGIKNAGWFKESFDFNYKNIFSIENSIYIQTKKAAHESFEQCIAYITYKYYIQERNILFIYNSEDFLCLKVRRRRYNTWGNNEPL